MTGLGKLSIGLAIPAAAASYPLIKYLMRNPWPTCLADINTLTVAKGYGEQSFGHKYSRYMVDPSKDSNESWWNFMFNKRLLTDFEDNEKKAKIDSSFKENNELKPKQGYPKNKKPDVTLNKVCETLLKENYSSNSSKEDSIWRYCSLFEHKPKFLEKHDKDSTFGKTHKTKLVDLDAHENKSFWDYQEYRITNIDESKFSDSDKSTFKSKRKGIDTSKSVKELCREAYGKSDSDVTDYKQDIWEFCSLTGKES